MIALVVGFGTVLSPRANWMITGCEMNGAYAAGFAGLLRPLGVVDQGLDRGGTGDGVDQERQVAKRDVLVEVRRAPAFGTTL